MSEEQKQLNAKQLENVIAAIDADGSILTYEQETNQFKASVTQYDPNTGAPIAGVIPFDRRLLNRFEENAAQMMSEGKAMHKRGKEMQTQVDALREKLNAAQGDLADDIIE